MLANEEISLQIATDFKWGILRGVSVLKGPLKLIIAFTTDDIYLLTMFLGITSKHLYVARPKNSRVSQNITA